MKLSVLCCNVYPGEQHIEFMLKNLAVQTYRDCEIVIADACCDENADLVKRLTDELGFSNLIHLPACMHSHVGSWLHWEVFNNAALLASGDWLLYFGPFRYMHRQTVAAVADRASRNICTVLAQGAAVQETLEWSPDRIEATYGMSIAASGMGCYLSQTGFYSIAKDVLIQELNGHNEALVLHHWVDCDLSERSRHVGLQVEVMHHALVRIARDGHYDRMVMPTPICNEEYRETCAAWLMNALREERRIQVPVERFIHNGFEWIRCPRCKTVGVEHPESYVARLSNPAYRKAPINVGGVGRNLARLSADLNGLDREQQIELIQNSHTNPRYLEN